MLSTCQSCLISARPAGRLAGGRRRCPNREREPRIGDTWASFHQISVRLLRCCTHLLACSLARYDSRVQGREGGVRRQPHRRRYMGGKLRYTRCACKSLCVRVTETEN